MSTSLDRGLPDTDAACGSTSPAGFDLASVKSRESGSGADGSVETAGARTGLGQRCQS